MNCPSCGAPIRVGAGFCGNCGAKLEAFAPSVVAPVSAPVQSPPLAPPPPPPVVHAEPQVAPTVAPPVVPPAPSFTAPSVVQPVAPPVFSVPAPPAAPPLPTSAEAQEESPLPAIRPVPAVPEPPVAAEVSAQATVGMVTPPPGLFDAAQQPASLVPTDDDLDATVVSSRKRPRSPWHLVLPDGQPYAIESTVLLGRDVKPRAKWPSAKLLSVDDPTKSVSKTHAVLEADAEQLWITDLKSTNGVVVTSPDGDESDGDDGGRVRVQPGSTITLGKYVIQVEKD